MTSQSPKKCPICGTHALQVISGDVVCQNGLCGCRLNSGEGESYAGTVSRWNRRRELESRVSPGAATANAKALDKIHASAWAILNRCDGHERAIAYAEWEVIVDCIRQLRVAPSSAPEEATASLTVWQTCPTCNGLGVVPFNPAMPTSTTQAHGGPWTCPTCHGGRVISSHSGASRSSGEDQPSTCRCGHAMHDGSCLVRVESGPAGWCPCNVGRPSSAADDEILALKQQVIDSALRAERLEADRTALIEQRVWPVLNRVPFAQPEITAWRTSHPDHAKLGVATFDTADEALAAYRASLSPQPAQPTVQPYLRCDHCSHTELLDGSVKLGQICDLCNVGAFRLGPPQPAEPTGATKEHFADIASSTRNWTEDDGHENGHYFNTCTYCGKNFTGHKRRVICKLCASHPAEPERETTR